MPFKVTPIFFMLLSAAAFAQGESGLEVRLPEENTIITAEGVRSSHAFAKANATFARFLGANPEWDFRFDEVTNAPHRAWGNGIRIDGFPSINLMNAPQAGRQFVRDHAGVLNAQPENLRLLYSEIVDGKVYQKYIQQYNGLDVLNSHVDLRISSDGRVFMFGSDYKQGITVSISPSLGVSAARAFAKAGFATPPPDDLITGGKLSILPIRYATRYDYHLVYNFVIASGPEEVWNTYVDAHSGTVLWRKNMVVHFREGDQHPARPTANVVNVRVTGSIAKDSWLYGYTTMPMASMYVNVGNKEYITDADGRFTADLGTETTAAVVARLAGPYVTVRRADSSVTVKNAKITTSAVAGQDLNIVWDQSNSVAAARMAAFHINAVRKFVRSLDASNKLIDIDKQITSVVNVASTCNANWDGSKVNFYASGGGCGNTGEIADVIYHEYGHAVNQFMYTRLRGSSMSNGTLGEATADILANMLRDDAHIGIGFVVNGANEGIIRNSDNSRVYPRDIVNEIHDDGMILTGAVWDMRKAIGIDAARTLTHKVKYGTPDGVAAGEVFADYFIEMLVADDDDGNLANGTPHSADIIPAFIKHGIPASGLSLRQNPLGDQSSVTQPYALSGDILVASAINQNLLTVSEITCFYTTDGWQSTQSTPLNITQSTKSFSGSIPAQKEGTIVRYYYECKDNYGSIFRVPSTAPQQDYLFLVGFERKVYYDCETADSWTVVSDCQTGKWVRGKPVGTYNVSIGTPPDVPWIQPNTDHTPGVGIDKCWVTGNGAFNATDGPGFDDVDDGYTNLTTQTYDISQYREPVLRYYRWYSNNQGASPGVDFWNVRISSDGGSTWKTVENTNAADASWQPRVFRLRDFVDPTDKFQVLFSVSDSVTGKQSLVEGAVDDFELLDINQTLSAVEDPGTLPVTLNLEQNYPNPFNPTTAIAWTLPAEQAVQLRIYSPLGALIATLVDAKQSAGRHSLAFDASSLPSGVYTYVLVTGGVRLAKKMVVVK